MNKPDLTLLHGKSPLVRALVGFVALVVAAGLGVGSVVLVSKFVGPTNSASGNAVGLTQVPTTSLPAPSPPGPALAPLDAAAPVPSTNGMSAALAPALSNPNLGTLAAQVIDPATGSVLFDQAGAATMKPASTLKLYTAAAAAVVLDPGMRITTKVVQGAAPGEVVIIGGGDPTITALPAPSQYPGSATLQQLADNLKAAGITSVTKITVDNQLFEGPATAQGWGSGDAPSTYAAPIYPFMLDAGRIDPANYKSQRHGSPDLAAAQAFAVAMGSPGAVVERGTADPAAPLLASVQSAPVEQLIEQMVAQSDNVLAECIGRLIAAKSGQPRTFEGAVAAIQQTLLSAGVDLTGFAAYDASGLSTLDRASAQSLASLLSMVTSGAQPLMDVVVSALAVSGYSGTLTTRFEGGDPAASAAGKVRAKTGTLTAVNSLAGTVITKDGRLLIFALISNGSGPVEATRAALDDLAAVIASCGCQ